MRHSWATDCPPQGPNVFGDTGSGKTVLCKQLAAESGRVTVVIDPLKVIDGLPGWTVHSVSKVREAFSQGVSTVVFRPHWDGEKAYEQVETLVNWLFRLAERTPNTGYMLVCDESHNFASKSDDSSPIVRVFKEGRNYDIKGVTTSQEPSRVHHSVLQQGYTAWLGGVNEFQRDYLENYNLPIDEIKQNGPHDALILDKNMEPVERVRAKERYV